MLCTSKSVRNIIKDPIPPFPPPPKKKGDILDM